MTEIEPTAWLYTRDDGSKDLVLDCNGEYARALLELGAVETPLFARTRTAPSGDEVERVARAIHGVKMEGHNPDCLYEHHEWEKWPVDDRREYADPFTGATRVQLFHMAWRRYESAAQAAIAAMREHMLPAGWQRRMRWPLASDPPGKTYPWEQCGHDEATSHFDRRAGCEYRAIYTFPAAPTEGEG